MEGRAEKSLGNFGTELAGNVRQRIAEGRRGEGKRVHLMLTGGRELSR